MRIFQLATLLFFITTCIWFKKTNDLKRSNERTKTELSNTIKTLRSEQIDNLERLTIYYLITLEQNKVIEKFQSSRNEKLMNTYLRDLQQKLN